MSAPLSLNYSQKIRRDGAGFYLSEIARGFLKGEVVLNIGGKRFVIPAAEFVDVEIDLEEMKRVYRIEVKLSWLRIPAGKMDLDTDRKAS